MARNCDVTQFEPSVEAYAARAVPVPSVGTFEPCNEKKSTAPLNLKASAKVAPVVESMLTGGFKTSGTYDAAAVPLGKLTVTKIGLRAVPVGRNVPGVVASTCTTTNDGNVPPVDAARIASVRRLSAYCPGPHVGSVSRKENVTARQLFCATSSNGVANSTSDPLAVLSNTDRGLYPVRLGDIVWLGVTTCEGDWLGD
jgi:hypothetical protein